MLWTKVNMLLVSGLCALSQVSGAANVAQQIEYMDTMTEKIGAARDSLNNYSGGIPSSLGVARSIMVAQTSTREAREKLADEDRMTAEEGNQYYDSYSRMVPVLLDAIHSAKDKVCFYGSTNFNFRLEMLTELLCRPPFSKRLDWPLKLAHIWQICTAKRDFLNPRPRTRSRRKPFASLSLRLTRSALHSTRQIGHYSDWHLTSLGG